MSGRTTETKAETAGGGGIRAYRTLRNLANGILVGNSLDTMLQQLPLILGELLPVDALSVLLLDRRTQTLVPLLTAAGGMQTTGHPLPLAGGRMQEAVAARRPLIISHSTLIDGDVPVPLSEAESMLTAMLIPLPMRQGMHGFLWLGRVHGAPFTPDEQELAETFATLVAMAIQRYWAERQLRESAQRDSLTGLFNQGAFQESLSRKLRTDTACTLLLIDIDHFQQFNDTYGFQIGNSLLREAGRLLRDTLRAEDETYRYGGEELAAILHDVDATNALLVAERVRRAFAGLQVGGADRPITVSIGLARAPEDAREKSALIVLADAALAAAKRAGRNRVVRAADLGEAQQWLPQVEQRLVAETLASAGTEDTVSLLRERLVALAEQASHRHASAELVEEAVVALARAIAARDPHTADHPDAVGRYAALIGRELGQSPRELDLLELAGRLHDIGTVDLPDELLVKTEELTSREQALVRRHPGQGARILEPLSSLAPVLPGVLHHHERYGGGGYPAGLTGEEIPLLARVVAVADTFDSLVSGRAYRPAIPVEQALQELRRRAGTSLDPAVVEAFTRGLRTED